MDYFVSREKELEVDLESGGNTSEEDRTEGIVPADKHKDRISERAWSEIFSFAKSEKFVFNETAHSSSSNFCEDADQNVELSMYKNSDSDESINYTTVAKKQVKVKCKKINSRNPPKPPRPPRGPLLDAADRKLIKEITELAVRKRARVERIKVLKKMKASKALPSSSSLSGMVVTLVFFLVLIYQGLSPGSSPGTSPETAIARSEDLISVQFYSNFSASGSTRPGSTSHNSADNQISGSDLPRKVI